MLTSQGDMHFVSISITSHPLDCTCRPFSNAPMLFVLFFSIRQRGMKGSLFIADMSRWLQKPLNVATLTAVRGHSSNDWVREKVGKMRRTGGGCKSAEEGSAQVDETFLGRLPPGSAGPRWPFRHFSVCLYWEVSSCLCAVFFFCLMT